MDAYWDTVLSPIIDALVPDCLVEVGVGSGALTRRLLAWSEDHAAVVHAIDPEPQEHFEALLAEPREQLVFHRERSLNVLGRLAGVGLALIDGDHNWYTVIHELRLLERTALELGAEPPVIALHDVDWPYGRRDCYDDPEAIPPAHRQAYAVKGIVPGVGELADTGYNAHRHNAIYEHAIHNGVRTAVEDFLAASTLEWTLYDVPGLGGLAVLAPTARLTAEPKLDAVLRSFHSPAFLRGWVDVVELARVRAEIGQNVDSETEANELDRLVSEQIISARDARERLLSEVARLERELEAAITTETDLRRELTAARASVAEAEQPAGVAAGTTNGTPPSASAQRWYELSAILDGCEASTSDTIAEHDSTFGGNRPGYLAVSRSALHAILQGLAAAGVSQPSTILDLGCGYGRVTRTLRAAWPDARLVAADQSAAAVSFCVEQFAADGWEVDSYLELAEQPDRTASFDLIWSASLLSSIDPQQLERWLADALGLLAPDGVLVAAFHGRDSARRFSERPDPGLRALGESCLETGVGFRADSADGRGTAALAPHWLLSHLAREREATVVSLTERGWADHLDVIAVMRRDLHHSQLDVTALT